MPTFVASYGASGASVWGQNTSPLTASVTVADGDTLVLVAVTSNSGNTLTTPTGGSGVTWTLQQSAVTNGSSCFMYVWTATGLTAQTFTVSVARTAGANVWGFRALRFSGVAGIGGSNIGQSTGAATVTFTATGANSAIVLFDGDWNAVAPGSPVYSTATAGTFTQIDAIATSTFYTTYSGYYADAGAAGSKTVGVTTPSGQKWTVGAVELLAPTDPGWGEYTLESGAPDGYLLEDGSGVYLLDTADPPPGSDAAVALSIVATATAIPSATLTADVLQHVVATATAVEVEVVTAAVALPIVATAVAVPGATLTADVHETIAATATAIQGAAVTAAVGLPIVATALATEVEVATAAVHGAIVATATAVEVEVATASVSLPIVATATAVEVEVATAAIHEAIVATAATAPAVTASVALPIVASTATAAATTADVHETIAVTGVPGGLSSATADPLLHLVATATAVEVEVATAAVHGAIVATATAVEVEVVTASVHASIDVAASVALAVTGSVTLPLVVTATGSAGLQAVTAAVVLHLSTFDIADILDVPPARLANTPHEPRESAAEHAGTVLTPRSRTIAVTKRSNR